MNAALELVSNCERLGVKISVKGQKLKIDAPINLPDSVKEALRQHKADIIRTLTKHSERTLRERLNRMIGRGAAFDVGTDDFQISSADYLTEAERSFLTVNKIYVLCTLQQSLLMKYLPENLIHDFIFEVKERAAVLADGADSIEMPFEIVRDVTSEWFADLLDEMLNPATNL
jgi:hypothetical protein